MKDILCAQRRSVAMCCVLTVVLGMLISADAFVLQALIRAVEDGGRRRFAVCAAAAVAVVAVEALVYWRRQSCTERLARRLLAELRSRVFLRLDDVPLSGLAGIDADRLLSQMTAQLGQIKADLIDVGLYGLILASQVAFAIAAIMAISPLLGMCALVLCVPMALVPIAARSRVERARGGLVEAENDLNARLGDLLRGLADWRLFGRGRQVVQRFARCNESWLQRAETDAAVQTGVDAVVNALSHVLIFGIWLIGGALVMRGNLDVARIVAMYALIGNISVPLFQMSGLIAQWHAGCETLAALRREVASWNRGGATSCGSTPESSDTTVPASESRGAAVPVAAAPSSGPLDAAASGTCSTGVVGEPSAGGAAGTVRLVCRALRLHGAGRAFDLDLPMDGVIVVRGPSGAGKSSLLRALAGLDDDYRGIARMRDAASTGRDAPPMRPGYLSQHSHVFHDTIRENVRLFDERMDDAAVLRALDAAQLGGWARERGLDAVVDDSLNLLSGGERQRLLLARVFAQGYGCCLLDEFDTGLDADTAQRLERVIAGVFRCAVIVTHRASPWLTGHASAIVTMRDGTVVDVARADDDIR